MARIPILTGALIALGIHLAFGWQYSVLGGVLAGLLAPDKAVWSGSIALFLSWGSLVVYNFVTAGQETINMIGVIAQLMGELPSVVAVAVTLMIALVLGALGGWLGDALTLHKTKSNSQNG